MEFSQSMSMRMGQNQILTPHDPIHGDPPDAGHGSGRRIDHQEMQANPVLEMNLKGDGRKEAPDKVAGTALRMAR